MGEGASVVLLANVSLEIPCFGIKAIYNYLYYHSTTFLKLTLSLDTLKSMIGIAMLYVDGFSTLIKNVASVGNAESVLKKFLESEKRT